MRIFNRNILCEINEVKKGEIFEYQRTIYIKIDDIYIPSGEKGKGKTYNVFNLETSEIEYIHFLCDVKVTPYPYAELNLDGRNFEE